jgi:hypothetical protein
VRDTNSAPDLLAVSCLDFYKVRERLAVGQVSNIFTILETRMQAD